MLSGEVARKLFNSKVMLIFGGYWPDFAIYPDILLLFFLLLVLAARTDMIKLPAALARSLADKANIILRVAIGSLLIVVLVGVRLLHKEWQANLALSVLVEILLLIWLIERVRPSITVIARLASHLRRRSGLLATALVVFILTPSSIKAIHALGNEPSVDVQMERMSDYVERHTEKNEMILVVPFFDTRKYPVMPLRPVFVDWSDGQYVLYDPTILDKVLERIHLTGMNVDKAIQAKQCASAWQYLDPMRRRKLLESLAMDYSDAWRGNLPKMRQIAPNLTYVLMRSKYVKPGDNVTYTSGDISLIKLSHITPQPSATSIPRSHD